MSRHFTALALAFALAGPAHAIDLTIGRATEHTSLDPHFSLLGNDGSTANNMFDSLIDFDAKLRIMPRLATSWTVIDPLTWKITLRTDVTFHDGTELTAHDVAYSLNRARSVPNSPAPWTSFVRPVKTFEVVDKHTLLMHTHEPTPLLLDMLGRIHIVPASLGPRVTTEDFNAGRAMIGSGPYRFRSSAHGDKVVMTANPSAWGKKPEFATVTLKFISSAAARTAALLSGSVDVIEQIPPSDLAAFQNRADVTLHSTVSTRIIYLAMDQGRDESPFITDKDGKPMTVNPLKDQRIRLALSKMINRQAIAERVMVGAAEPAGQIVPEGMSGYHPDLKPTPFDPEGARRLLREAGYPDGFGVTVHGSNNRFPNDSQLTQALGQMFQRGGLRVNAVEVFPYNVYAPGATQRKYSLFHFSYGSVSSSSLNGLTGVLATWNAEKGTGSLNRARYSNRDFDAALAKAAVEFDVEARDRLLADAARIAMDDVGIIPLYWQKLYWASRKGYVVTPDRGEQTSIHFVSPAR